MTAEDISPTYWRDKYHAARREIVRLRERSESYWRDAVVFRSEGDIAMAVAYETIARELREAALIDGLEGGSDG